MKTSTKLITTAAASLLGVALAGGAAYATGSLTASDAPGQVLQVSGVGPASAHASDTAKANADANARGLFGTDVSAAEASEADATGTDATADSTSAQGAQSSTNTANPVAPSTASKSASTVSGSETGKSISAWAHAQSEVEAVAPGAAVSVDAGVSVKAGN